MSVVALDGGVVWLCRRLLLLIITSTLDIATDDQLVGWIWRNEGVKLENTTFMKLQITYLAGACGNWGSISFVKLVTMENW